MPEITKEINQQLTITETISKRLQIEDFLVSDTIDISDHVHRTTSYFLSDSLTIEETVQEPLPYLFMDTLSITEIETMTLAMRNYAFLDPLIIKEYKNHYFNL